MCIRDSDKTIDLLVPAEKTGLPPLPSKREDLPPKVGAELLETPAEVEIPEAEEKRLLEKSETREFMPVAEEVGVVAEEEPKKVAEPSGFGQDLPMPDIPPVEIEDKETLPPLPKEQEPAAPTSAGTSITDEKIEVPPVKEEPTVEVSEKPGEAENELAASVNGVLAELKPTPPSKPAGLASWKTSSVGLNLEDKSDGNVLEQEPSGSTSDGLPPLNLTTTGATAQSGDKLAPEQNVPEDFSAWVNK